MVSCIGNIYLVAFLCLGVFSKASNRSIKCTQHETPRWCNQPGAGSPTVQTPTSLSSLAFATSNGFAGRVSRSPLAMVVSLKLLDIWTEHDQLSRWVLERTALEDSPLPSWTRCGKQSLRQMSFTSLERRRLHCHSGWNVSFSVNCSPSIAATRCTWRPEAARKFLPGKASWACWRGKQSLTSSWSI